MDNVLVTGGWAHPYLQAGPALVQTLDEVGVRSTVVTDLDVAGTRIELGCDLVTVNACRFRMLDERYSSDQRSEFAAEAPARLRAAIEAHLAPGRPLLALHTAPICFDDWPDWGVLLGGRWVWGESYHPPVDTLRVRPVGDHPIVAGVSPFTIVDERYSSLDVSNTVHILAVAESDEGDHPVSWVHTVGSARVAVDLLGHDHRSYEARDHRLLLHRIVRWLQGDDF
jgi:type 1 glutamine amidotransferase